MVSAAALVAFAMVACSSQTIVPVKEPEGCKFQVVGMSVIASPRINPDKNGEARPVQVRIYQLKTDVRLLNADFEPIWKDDKATLQDDLVKVDEFPVYPDTRTEIHFERDETALFVAAVALFRNPTGRSWWTTFELPPPPGKGNCGMPPCTGPNCDAGAGPNLVPKYAVWIDSTRVTNGEDHLDENPSAARIRDLHLRFSRPLGAPAAAPSVTPPAVQKP